MKRAYCSKDCQRADLSVKENGQRHVNWCRRHECGEEDVDVEVVPIPNKGLGIRAKKLIPVGMKIIVEPSFSHLQMIIQVIISLFFYKGVHFQTVTSSTSL